MGKKFLKYTKPKISAKKLKISFFLSNISFVDQFSLLGDVYAQSGDSFPDANIAMPADVNGDGQYDGAGNPGTVA